MVKLSVKNYRCFPDSHPLRLDVARGFTSFVGINNAGKSSILRLFWEFGRVLEYLGNAPRANHVNPLNGNLNNNVNYRVLPGEEVFSKLNDRDMTLTFEWSAPNPSVSYEAKHEVEVTIPHGQIGFLLSVSLDGNRLAGNDFRFPDDQHLAVGDHLVVDLGPFFDACQFLGNGMYLGPFRNTINVGANEPYFDIVVGQQFVGQFHTFKTGADPAANEAIYRLIQDIKRIFSFNDLDINASADGKSLQVFIDGRSFRLSELGTGIAQFILVLANVLVKRPSLILIDEPETSLHPTLQLDFLTTLASYTKESSVFYATHNLGLARAASDRIYSCRRLELG